MAIGYWPLAVGSFNLVWKFHFYRKLPEAKSQKPKAKNKKKWQIIIMIIRICSSTLTTR